MKKDAPLAAREGLFIALLELTRSTGSDTVCRPAGVTLAAAATALAACREWCPVISPEMLASPQFLIYPELAAMLAESAQGVLPDAYLAATRTPAHDDQVLLHWWSQLARGSLYQGDAVFRIANVLVLTGLRGYAGLQASPEAVNDLFSRQLGSSAEDFFTVLFALWATSLKSAVVQRANFFAASNPSDLLRKTFDVVTGDLSKPTSISVRSILELDQQSGHALAEAFFARWPLIQVAPEAFAVAGHPFLEIQLAFKFLAKALALARVVENRAQTTYSSIVGERHEKFVGELLKASPVRHEPEHQYEYGQDKKSADFTLIEKHASKPVVSLLQLKLKMFQESAFYGASLDRLTADLTNGFVPAIAQSIRYLRHLHEANDADRLRADTAAISREILQAEKLLLVCVTPDAPAMMTSFPLRERFLSALKADVGANWAWFEQKYDGRWAWHVIGLHEMETFLSLPPSKQRFYAEMSAYLRESKVDQSQFSADMKVPVDFRSFLINKHARFSHQEQSHKLPLHPTLLEVFSSFSKDVVSKMAFKKV